MDDSLEPSVKETAYNRNIHNQFREIKTATKGSQKDYQEKGRDIPYKHRENYIQTMEITGRKCCLVYSKDVALCFSQTQEEVDKLDSRKNKKARHEVDHTNKYVGDIR